MKYYEELTRQRVDDALQLGLRSQSLRRALKTNQQATPAAPLEKGGESHLRQFNQPSWFTLFFYWILGLGG